MKSFSIPAEIKVGHLVYSVEGWPASAAARDGAYGQCDSLNQRIMIRLDMTPAMTGEVLLHEVLHAIYRVFGVPSGGEQEPVVEAIGNGLATVMTDNPELVKFLTKAFKGG